MKHISYNENALFLLKFSFSTPGHGSDNMRTGHESLLQVESTKVSRAMILPHKLGSV